VIIESQSLLITQRTFNNTFIAIIFTLLGSVFGLMQIIGSVMSFAENISESFQKKIKKIVRLGKIARQRKYLDNNFYQNEKPVITQIVNSKVCPDLTDINITNF
jgi:hypothetical protein